MMLEPLGEVGANISLQLSSLTLFTKINNKKLSPKTNVKKHKNSSLVRMWIIVKIGRADWSMLERLLLLHV